MEEKDVLMNAAVVTAVQKVARRKKKTRLRDGWTAAILGDDTSPLPLQTSSSIFVLLGLINSYHYASILISSRDGCGG